MTTQVSKKGTYFDSMWVQMAALIVGVIILTALAAAYVW